MGKGLLNVKYTRVSISSVTLAKEVLSPPRPPLSGEESEAWQGWGHAFQANKRVCLGLSESSVGLPPTARLPLAGRGRCPRWRPGWGDGSPPHRTPVMHLPMTLPEPRPGPAQGEQKVGSGVG